ncbi:SIS domain-containing protein [Petroclostridium sp. X23]|uniref:SIS domain-containing protein n=1 Tax=Petroclostridium sp. X23 TaxID=3045146 RepID=UPI0024ACBE90|nr:SIS domain-containing protein [Petroclostridium sp. X23]WHH56860.1 SIS domain-containing protein [Petroclostridium sp. X23]
MKQNMKGCMFEQPDTIRNVIFRAPEQVERVCAAVGEGPFQKIYLIGSGTSLHAAIAAKYAFARWLDAEVQVLTPFEFLYYFPHDRVDESTLVLGVSQTARSIGTINCVELSRKRGAKTVFVTAEPDNLGAASAHVVLDTCTGQEMVGAKTKGFTSTMAMLYLFAARLSGKALDLSQVPDWMEETFRQTRQEIEALAEEYKTAPSVTILGGGPLSAAAKEGGLKMLEGVRIPVEVYDVEEYMHGPYHCLEQESHLIFLVNGGAGTERAKRMIQFSQEHSNHVLVIGYKALAKEMDLNCKFLPLPEGMDEILSPLFYVLPLQWLSNDATEKKGRRPEQSRYPQFHAILGSKFMPKVNYYEG